MIHWMICLRISAIISALVIIPIWLYVLSGAIEDLGRASIANTRMIEVLQNKGKPALPPVSSREAL